MDSALPPVVPTARPLGALTTRGVHGLCSLGTAATPTDRTRTAPRSGASGESSGKWKGREEQGRTDRERATERKRERGERVVYRGYFESRSESHGLNLSIVKDCQPFRMKVRIGGRMKKSCLFSL